MINLKKVIFDTIHPIYKPENNDWRDAFLNSIKIEGNYSFFFIKKTEIIKIWFKYKESTIFKTTGNIQLLHIITNFSRADINIILTIIPDQNWLLRIFITGVKFHGLQINPRVEIHCFHTSDLPQPYVRWHENPKHFIKWYPLLFL